MQGNKKAFKKPNKKLNQKKQKALCYADMQKAFCMGEHTMSKKISKKTAIQKAIELLASQDFDTLQAIEAKVADTKKQKASKMPDAEKMKRLEGYDREIKSLTEQLHIQKRLRSQTAHSLGLTEIVKASRNGSKVWDLAFTVAKKGKAKSLTATVKKEGSTKKPFVHTFQLARIGGHDTLTKASRKEGFEKLAIWYGIDTLSKQYNNISTNNWLASMVAFCSEKQIAVERKQVC